jgi:hypothetical protein
MKKDYLHDKAKWNFLKNYLVKQSARKGMYTDNMHFGENKTKQENNYI